MKSATFQIYSSHSNQSPKCQETQPNNISTFRINQIICIFRTSGHQDPVKVQQTRCPGKVTLIKIMKSYLKVIPFYLWVKQFCRAGNSLNIQKKHQTTSFPYPTHLDPRFPDKVDINKINLHTGKIGTGKKK